MSKRSRLLKAKSVHMNKTRMLVAGISNAVRPTRQQSNKAAIQQGRNPTRQLANKAVGLTRQAS